MAIKVTIRGERHLDAAFRRRLKAKRLRVHQGVRRVLLSIVRGYRRRVRRRTGRLARSARVEMGAPPRGRGRVVVPPFYAIMEEEGTRPHTITPRQPGGVLRWVGRDGQVHFARRVRHPGTKGSHALQKAVDANRSTLRAVVGRLVEA